MEQKSRPHFEVEPLQLRGELRQTIAEVGARALAVVDREATPLKLPSSIVAVVRARRRNC